MNKAINLLSTFMAVVVLFSSCASIVSKSAYPISIKSNPSDAKITITDKRGIDIYSGKSPVMTYLDAGSGYFSKATYLVKIEKEGFQSKVVPVEFRLDGWYIGNIVFGGLIGFLIVDPATGAMYKLETEFINETLMANRTVGESIRLNLRDINDLPAHLRKNLVLLSE